MAIMLIGILLIGAGCADSQQAQPSQESKNDLAAGVSQNLQSETFK